MRGLVVKLIVTVTIDCENTYHYDILWKQQEFWPFQIAMLPIPIPPATLMLGGVMPFNRGIDSNG
jgi:hypothetical protein